MRTQEANQSVRSARSVLVSQRRLPPHGARSVLRSIHAMLAQPRKCKWLALALLVALPLVALWSLPSAPPPVHVAFQHATNDPSNGRVGVIKVVNNLNETVTVMSGWYVPAKRKDLSIGRDTLCALRSDEMWKFSARRTNIAQVSIPTHWGPTAWHCSASLIGRVHGTIRAASGLGSQI